MKNSNKTLLISCGGIVALLLLINQFFGHLDESKNLVDVDPGTANVETGQPVSKPVLAIKQQSTKVEKAEGSPASTRASDNTPQSGKKSYDGDWCIAKDELSEADYQFAQTELKDWNELQGRARARNPGSSYVDEFEYPNNHYLESYEALPLEQLRSMAVKGNDKWAMVAYVQDQRTNDQIKNEVAKKLMVIGASYYALEHLVITSLVAAQTSIEHDDTQEAVNHVVDALAYAYWGLEQYNDGGLGPFVALTKGEPFKTRLPLRLILPKSEKAIQNRILEFDNWIQQERTKAGIDLPEPAKAVQKLFANNIAVREFISKEQLDLLRSLDITANRRINTTPCIEQHLANMKAKRQ